MKVQVVWAMADRQEVMTLDLPEDARVSDALDAIGHRLPEDYLPASAALEKHIGIWGRRCDSKQFLKAGDRVEIYRPLIADPKQMRRERAASAKKSGSADQLEFDNK